MAMGLSHALETRDRRRSIRGRPLYEDESERISIMARSQRLHSRPNTLAQTNCHRSFFACNSAADHTFPVNRHGISSEQVTAGRCKWRQKLLQSEMLTPTRFDS